MKILTDTLEAIIGTWDDPGNYPNGLGIQPMPSYDYVEDIERELVLTLTGKEVDEFILCPDDFLVNDIPHHDIENVLITEWEWKLTGNTIKLEVAEFENCNE